MNSEIELNMYSTEFDHIIYPRHINQDNHLESGEPETRKEHQ